VIAALLWGAAPARADEATVALTWTSREGCLDGAAVEAAVRTRTRRVVRAAEEADAVLTGTAAARPGGGWAVEIVVTDRRRGVELGRRALEVAPSDCAALRDHVALVMAMLADSSVVDPAAVAPPRATAQARRWRAVMAAGAVVEAGRLPGATPGITIALGVEAPGRWGAELRAAGFAAASATEAGGESELRRGAIGVLGCAPAWRAAGWRTLACAGLEVAAVSAEGAGFARNRTTREVLVDAVADVAVERQVVGPVSVRADLWMCAAVRRARFGYEDEAGTFQTLYRPRVFGGMGGFGVVVRFP
jgi:hypothetical protein